MTVFVDASAIVKRYVAEAWSPTVAELGERIVVSDLSVVEVPSAIWRKHRAGELSAEDASLLVSAFSYDIRGSSYAPPRFATVELSSGVLDRAAELLPRHDLRASDAVQLACAIVARESLEFCDTFVAFDRRLRLAAMSSGFVVSPLESEMEHL